MTGQKSRQLLRRPIRNVLHSPCYFFTIGWTANHRCCTQHLVTISDILGVPLVNLTGCEIRFVFWLLRASGRVEPLHISLPRNCLASLSAVQGPICTKELP